jgi:glycosyl hydrolase family 2/beta-galactosidase-like protein
VDIALSVDGRLIFLGRALRSFAFGWLSVILALYLAERGFSAAAIGAVFTATMVEDALLTMAVSTLAARVGPALVMAATAPLMAVGGLLLATAGTPWLLLVGAVLGTLSPNGQDAGPFAPMEQALLPATVRTGPVVRVFGWYNVFSFLPTALGAAAAGGTLGALLARGAAAVDAQRLMLFGYAGASAALTALYVVLARRLRQHAPPAVPSPAALGLGRSRGAVLELAGLQGLDALAGGFIMQSLLAYWFHVRFGVGPEALGALFFGTNLMSALSFLAASRIAERFGLLNTMVFTHLPSNLLLLGVPFMPTFGSAAALLLARHVLSQMDVPTRQAFTVALVAPEERAAATGFTASVRALAQSAAPSVAGLAMGAAAGPAPFLLAGGLKIVYDLCLYFRFRSVRLAPVLLLLAPLAASGAPPETETLYLSGRYGGAPVPWDFRCGAGRNCGAWAKIPVPSNWEQAGFGAYAYGRAPQERDAAGNAIGEEEGLYRTSFVVPPGWTGKHVRLVFEGAMTDTEVRLNGVSAGPVHQGGFYRFAYDVTPLLKTGGNALEVTVRKRSANESVNRAERRGDYWNFGGIYRPVYLEALPPTFVDRLAVDARADGAFRAEVHLGGAPVAGRSLRAEIVDARGRAAGPPIVATLDASSSMATLDARVPGVRAWTAETPHLYRVRVTLLVRGRPQHVLGERFGFRTFEVRTGDGLYLNGRRIVLKGTNRHSFSADTGRALQPEASREDVRLIKAMNMNAVRMSHYPPDPHFLDACDELGLYVLDELSGWQAAYDAPTGRRLAGQMIRRDVNHPSILFWDNGNEGGWNVEIDGDFAPWDPQRRPVLHPWGSFGGIDTAHYRTYGETLRLVQGPDLYLPTEFLHGLYDGGNGAGLSDYWEAMRTSPFTAGGFLWAFVDECVARADRDGGLDCAGNSAPDGILGPRREREGSFEAVREIWSPVVFTDERFAGGALRVLNRYDFTDLADCRFEWTLARLAGPDEAGVSHHAVARGTMAGPRVPPGSAGELRLALPATWRDADVLYVTALDPAGREVWTASWRIREAHEAAAASGGAPVSIEERPDAVVISTGSLRLQFARASGAWSAGGLGGLPRFVASLRTERASEPVVEPGRVRYGGGKMGTTEYADAAGLAFDGLTARQEGDEAVVDARYGGGVGIVSWRIAPDGRVRVAYEYAFDGEADLLGLDLGTPAAEPQRIRWLGRGPYRVWKNRMKGTRLDVWENAANDARPGEDWTFPEVRGYFHDWRFAVLDFPGGRMTLERPDGPAFLGVLTPRDGAVGPLARLPETGIALLHAIPPIRNKFEPAELLGPEGQPTRVTGGIRGAVVLRLEAR